MNSIGVDFKLKNIEIDSKKIKLQIWDTAGQERFKTITTSYYKGAHAILIVFDITDRDSFDHVRNWMADIDKFAKEGVLRILVGNKCDLEQERKVRSEEAKEIANKYGIKYIETSAKDTINIDDLFISTAKYLLSKQIGGTGAGKGTQNGKSGYDLLRDNNKNNSNNNNNDEELIELDDHIEYKGKKLYKPFVEKPFNGDDHNIYIYYPPNLGGGHKRLFRKTKDLSSLYFPNLNEIRRDKKYIYEEFLQTDGFDIKVYTIGPDQTHAEARKSPTLDGKVNRTVVSPGYFITQKLHFLRNKSI